MQSLVPDACGIEASRFYRRQDQVFRAYRFKCRGKPYQVELPAMLAQPEIGAVIRDRPYFDSETETVS